MSRQL
ncbi:abb60dc8-dbcd-4b40-9949-b12a56bb3d28 [Thermothielavioides terrestris]